MCDDAVVVHQAVEVDAHGSLEHPRLTEIVPLQAVKVSNGKVDLSINQAGIGQTPFNRGRYLERQLFVLLADHASVRENLKAFIEDRTRVVKHGVGETQSLVVA